MVWVRSQRQVTTQGETELGFWHTGYMEFHEPVEWLDRPRPEPRPPTFPCERCGEVFDSSDDLAVHLFDGHTTARPVLLLRGRECGRSRLAVNATTGAQDWKFRNATAVRVNGRHCSDREAQVALASATDGVVTVVLEGEVSKSEFEFSFSIAGVGDLDGVDEGIADLVRGKSLTIEAIEVFIRRTEQFPSARRYRDSIANYFYGVLARERSAESGLITDDRGTSAYQRRFDEAVAELGRYDRAPAEAITGLVAFHYNQFDRALRKTLSPRVAQVAMRFAQLIIGQPTKDLVARVPERASLDYALSDNEIEQIIHWCSIPLDGTACREVADMETRLSKVEPADAMKLRIIAAEHYLACGERDEGRRHMAVLRQTKELDAWTNRYRERLEAYA